MKGKRIFVFSAFAVFLFVGTSVAYPVPPPTSFGNGTNEEFGFHFYKNTSMDQALESNSMFIRDTVSTKFVHFDLPKGAIGFYPINLTLLTSTAMKTSFMFVNSSSSVNLFMFKCGFFIPLGSMQKGHILFNTARIAALERVNCGRKWKNNYLKLIIGAEGTRSRGFVKLDGKHWITVGSDSSSSSLFWIIVGVALTVCVIFAPCLFCRRRCRTTNPQAQNFPEQWPMSTSFFFDDGDMENYPGMQIPLNPLPPYLCASDETLFEHEREELEALDEQHHLEEVEEMYEGEYTLNYSEDYSNEDSENSDTSEDSALATTMDYDTDL